MSGQCLPDIATDPGIRDVAPRSADLEGGDPAEIDRAQLVAEDDAVLRLAGMALRDRDLTGVLRTPMRDGADGRHARPMEGFVRNDQRSPLTCLLVPDGGVEVDEHDGPAERHAHSGHASARS